MREVGFLRAQQKRRKPRRKAVTVAARFDLRDQAVDPTAAIGIRLGRDERSEEHTSELQSLMRISYAVFCLKKKKTTTAPNAYRTHETKTQPHNHTTYITTHKTLAQPLKPNT